MKKLIEPNVIVGYDDKGRVNMYYWQKEPLGFKITNTFGTIPWYRRDWITEFKWWLQDRKAITIRQMQKLVKKL